MRRAREHMRRTNGLAHSSHRAQLYAMNELQPCISQPWLLLGYSGRTALGCRETLL